MAGFNVSGVNWSSQAAPPQATLRQSLIILLPLARHLRPRNFPLNLTGKFSLKFPLKNEELGKMGDNGGRWGKMGEMRQAAGGKNMRLTQEVLHTFAH